MENVFFENGRLYTTINGILTPIPLGGGGKGRPGKDGSDAQWIFAGDFNYTKWTPFNTSAGTIDVASIPSGYIVTGVAIRRLVSNSFQSNAEPNAPISIDVLPQEIMTIDMSPTPETTHYIFQQEVGGNLQVDLRRYCAGWNPYQSPEGGVQSPSYNWEIPYKLQAQLRLSAEGAPLNTLISGLISIWYKIELLP